MLFQGYPNLEYIVIDGGSSDDSVEIIRKYQDQLSYWVSEKDGGQAHAVNKGLEKATGDIVGWINSDDVYTSHAFITAMSHFVTSTEVGLVYGWRILIDEDTRVSGWVPNYPFNPQATGYNICSETAFWRRTPDDPRLREDLKFAMDLDFFVRLFHSRRSAHCNTFLGCFRCYSANKSSTIQDVGRQEAMKIWEAKYGIGHAGWTKYQAIGRSRAIQSLVTSPKTVAIPYIYRRVFLGKRGL